MCHGNGCKQRRKCWRALATPNPERQSYFTKTPKKTLHCEFFMRPPQGWTKRGR